MNDAIETLTENGAHGVARPTLLPNERVEWAACKLTIKRGFQAMADMGEALARARHKELYREDYGTFAAFCEDFCGFDVRYAQRLMVFADIMRVLALPESNTAPGPRWLLPPGERHARPLAGLPEGQWRPVWAEVVATAAGLPTVRHVEKVVREFKTRHGISIREESVQPLAADALPLDEVTESVVRQPLFQAPPVVDVKPVGGRDEEFRLKFDQAYLAVADLLQMPGAPASLQAALNILSTEAAKLGQRRRLKASQDSNGGERADVRRAFSITKATALGRT